MDEHKNQGQQSQGQRHQPGQDQKTHQSEQTQNPNREPAKDPRRQDMPGQPDRTRGSGSQGERNRESGINNRGMDEMEEQGELPERGRSQSDR